MTTRNRPPAAANPDRMSQPMSPRFGRATTRTVCSSRASAAATTGNPPHRQPRQWVVRVVLKHHDDPLAPGYPPELVEKTGTALGRQHLNDAGAECHVE